jgi:hypothetical protein
VSRKACTALSDNLETGMNGLFDQGGKQDLVVFW